jgi:hypothetical protein
MHRDLLRFGKTVSAIFKNIVQQWMIPVTEKILAFLEHCHLKKTPASLDLSSPVKGSTDGCIMRF